MAADSASSSLLSITTTVPERAQGLALARAAVAGRLAACAQVDEQAVTSVYRWEGRVCEDAEWRVSFKTTSACEPALRALVAAQHPYQLPQWVVEPVQAAPAYAAWLRQETDG